MARDKRYDAILKPGGALEIKTPVGTLWLSAESQEDEDAYGCHVLVIWHRDKRIEPIDINGRYVVLGTVFNPNFKGNEASDGK